MKWKKRFCDIFMLKILVKNHFSLIILAGTIPQMWFPPNIFVEIIPQKGFCMNVYSNKLPKRGFFALFLADRNH